MPARWQRRRAGANSSATTSRPSSPTSKSACAPPPPTWNSRKPRRLRDELKRLHAVELAIADDPFARQSDVDRAVDDALPAAPCAMAREDKAAPQRGPKHQKTSRTQNAPRTEAERTEDVWE